jgi:cytochrome c oxidase assembly protein subunit 15
MIAQAVGLLTIGLVIVCYRCEPRRWVRHYSLWLLAGVVGQGVLGGMRVVLVERLLALVHGCVGPLFFAATAGMAAVTSRRWSDAATNDTLANRKLARLATLTAALAYGQLVLGAIVRHSQYLLSDNAGTIFRVAVYFPIAMAAAVTFHVLWLAVKCVRAKLCTGMASLLGSLIVVQLLLGASSWIVKFGAPGWFTQLFGETGHINRDSSLLSATILAAHGAVGALMVAGSVVVALHGWRRITAVSAAAVTSGVLLRGVPA